MGDYLIGIDLGGTNLPCGIVTPDAKVIARHEEPTRAEEGVEAVIERMAKGVRMLLETSGIAPSEILAVGVGAPGPLDGMRGIVLEAPNLGWKNVPLSSILRKKTGFRIVLENDANAAGYGEFWAGAGRGCQHMVMMTLGTGIGGAIILDGKLHRGPDWTAGEIGHVVIADGGRPCACGGYGCIEAYASATSTVKRFREQLALGWESSLSKRDPNTITCADIFHAAKEGDNLAYHIVAETGRYLGLMAANMANLLNPERCIFSGGMIKAGAILFDAIREACQRHAFKAPAQRLQILPAELGDDAGIIGAAGVALEAVKKG